MPVIGKRVTVANSPTLIAGGEDGGHVLVRNADASAAIDLGGQSVATGAGFSLIAGATVAFETGGTKKLYGVTASGTVIVHVLTSRRGAT
jgi:hypothetical protein